MPEVVITGLGVLSAAGIGCAPLFAATAPATSPWPADQQPPCPAAEVGTVASYPKERFFSERQQRQMDRAMTMSSTAVGLALEDAGLLDASEAQLPKDHTATMFATLRSEHASVLRFAQPLLQGNPRQINPAGFPQTARNIACGQIAIRFGLRGPSTMLTSGPVAGIETVARAAELIRRGRVPLAVVGGFEIVSKVGLYVGRHLYGRHLSGPGPALFGQGPGRFALSEGACMLVLESADHAQARGARAYARIDATRSGRLGRNPWPAALVGAWTDIPGGLADLALMSLSGGGSDRAHEIAERDALMSLGDRLAPDTALCAPRTWVGEGETWTSALQVAVAVHALHHGIIPATLGLAADAPAALTARTAGRTLAGSRALVAGLDADGCYGLITCSRLGGVT